MRDLNVTRYWTTVG